MPHASNSLHTAPWDNRKKQTLFIRSVETDMICLLLPDGVSESDLPAWLKFHQSELEILREKGKTEEALSLVNQMMYFE